MTSVKTAACVIVLSLGALASGAAAAHGVRWSFGFSFPLFAPYWYYPPPAYYYPPAYYPPAYYPRAVVTAPAAPPVYVERSETSAAPPPEHYWYYCADSQGYYPYVKDCQSEWQRVSPRPPGM